MAFRRQLLKTASNVLDLSSYRNQLEESEKEKQPPNSQPAVQNIKTSTTKRGEKRSQYIQNNAIFYCSTSTHHSWTPQVEVQVYGESNTNNFKGITNLK